MEVEFHSNEVVFHLGGHKIGVRFGWCTKYVYVDGECFRDIAHLVKDIINRRNVEAIVRLNRLAEEFRDPKTREKYADYWAKGNFITSRGLTAELRARAAVKNRKALGFRVDLSRFNKRLGEGWVFAGPGYGRGYWKAYVIPDNMGLIGYIEGDDVYVKEAVLGLVEGQIEAARKFSAVPLENVILYSLLEEMTRYAKEWGLQEFAELVGLVAMARELVK